MNRPVQRGSTAFLFSLAALLALAHAILGVTATIEKSGTADELAYLTAGHVYNTRHDFRLQPENGVLPQRWAALPEWLLDTPLPPVANPAWTQADVWRYGHEFFYASPARADLILFRGRAMMAIFSFATGLLIFCWSRALYGWRGGFFALLVFCLCPSFLAHGALATSDVPMTFFFLASIGAWWRHLRHPGVFNAGLSAFVFALACVTKFSAVLLVPMGAIIATIWALQSQESGQWRVRLARAGRSAAVHGAVAWITIWAFYEFRYDAFAPGLGTAGRFYLGDWAWITADLGWRGTVINGLRAWHVLPEAFLYGFTFVLQFASQRSAFLNGQYSLTGWFEFFPLAFLMKTTIPVLLLAAIALGRRLGAFRSAALATFCGGLSRLLPLLVLFFVYWAVSLNSHLNIGHRHLLPIYPVIFIGLGSLAQGLAGRRPVTLFLVSSLTVWHAVESFAIRPHYLSYFNQIFGGPTQGYKHLVDSSLDWGQDLPGLKQWLTANQKPGEAVYLSYFGTSEPDYYGIEATRLGMIPDFDRRAPWHRCTAGLYLVSATMLQQVYGEHRGPWTAELEREYQSLRQNEKNFALAQAGPAAHPELFNGITPEAWALAWKRYRQLRLARLCHYLRARAPDAMIGYSILIFHLNQTEVDAALNRDVRTLAAAMESAVAGVPAPTSP